MGILGSLKRVFTRLTAKPLTDEEKEEIFAFLVRADFGPALAEEIVDIASEHTGKDLWDRLKSALASYLPPAAPQLRVADVPPTVYYFFGVNGSGKTTVIAKIAHWLKEQGKRVLVVGADTFRAAATDQLALWAEKAGVDVFLGSPGEDPSAVIYKGLQKAKSEGYEYVLVDTAGRMPGRKNLVEELKKMYRVGAKVVPDAPHESFIVLDATQGQSAYRQSVQFADAVPITALIITKLDSTAKGGFIWNIWKHLKIPVAVVTFGQELDDWIFYSPSAILDHLFGGESDEKS